MKMKKIFTCLAMLLCTGYAMADELNIADVTIPQGGSGELVADFKVDGVRVGFAFALKLPEGFSVAKNGTKAAVLQYPASSLLGVSYVQEDGFENFGALPLDGEEIVLRGTQGTLLSVTIDVDASVEPGEYKIPVSKAAFQYRENNAVWDKNIEDFEVKVNVIASDRVFLRETSPIQPEDVDGVDVTVIRTINPNVWSTICLPFDMSGDQLKAAFGDDVEIAEYKKYVVTKDGTVVTDLDLQFENVDIEEGISGNYPYIIKTSKLIEEFDVDGVDVYAADVSESYDSKKTTVKGTYVAGVLVPDKSLFLSNNAFWYSDGETMMKGFRCYFTLKDKFTFTSSSRTSFTVNGEKTYVSDAFLMNEEGVGEVYDLQGRRVNNPGKGVYIQNGKKIFVK